MSAEPIASTVSPLRGRTVRGAMQLGLFNCPADTELQALARMMVERSIHCVVVRHLPDGKGYGIVTDLDLMRGLEDPRPRVAGDIATTDVISVRPDTTLETAAHLMAARGMSHLIVVSPETGFPVGMLSSLDIARAVSA